MTPEALPLAADSYNATFYSTVAQVVPVLFIALAVNVRLFRPREDEDAQDSLFRFSLVLLLVAAEFTSLKSLDAQRPPPWYGSGVIALALLLGGMALASEYLHPRVEAFDRHPLVRWAFRAYLASCLLAVSLAAVLHWGMYVPAAWIAGVPTLVALAIPYFYRTTDALLGAAGSDLGAEQDRRDEPRPSTGDRA